MITWFQCLIRGENFLLDTEDEPQLKGFYAARYAQANTAEEAELIMLENLKAEYEIIRPQKPQTDKPAKVYFEELEELSEEPKHIPNKGAVWFPMDGKD